MPWLDMALGGLVGAVLAVVAELVDRRYPSPPRGHIKP